MTSHIEPQSFSTILTEFSLQEWRSCGAGGFGLINVTKIKNITQEFRPQRTLVVQHECSWCHYIFINRLIQNTAEFFFPVAVDDQICVPQRA